MFPILRRYIWSGPRGAYNLAIAPVVMGLMPDVGVFMGTLTILMAALIAPPRAGVFDAALPIDARRIAFARLTGAWVGVLVPMLVWIIALKVRPMPMMADLTNNLLSDGVWTTVHVAQVVIVVLFAVTLPFAIRAGEMLPPPRHYVLLGWLVWALAYLAMARYLPAGIVLTLVLTALAALLYAVLVRAPQAFVAQSLTTSKNKALTSVAGAKHSDARWVWPLLRSTISKQGIVFTLLLLLFGTLNTQSPLLYLNLMLMMTLEAVRRSTRWLYALPLSHRTRFLVVFVPTVVTGVGCLSIGPSIPIPTYSGFMRSMYINSPHTYKSGEGYFESETKLPLQFWSRVSGDSAPLVVAPWGESAKAYTFSVPGATFYNPYSSVKTSSERFIDYQFARATTRVYGAPISRDAYQKRWENGLPRPVSSTLSVRIMEAGVFALYAFWAFLCFEAARKPWKKYEAVIRNTLQFAGMMPAFAVLVIDLRYGLNHGVQVVGSLEKMLLMNIEGRLHSNVLLVVTVTFVPLYGLYKLAEWQFSKSEPPKLVRKPAP